MGLSLLKEYIYMQVFPQIWIVFPYLHVFVIYLIKEYSPTEIYYCLLKEDRTITASF